MVDILRKFYYRTYQMTLRALLPVLPYREPNKLENYMQLAKMLKNRNITSVLLVTDKQIHSIGLTQPLEKALKTAGIKVAIYDDTDPNPTTKNIDASTEVYNQNSCEAIIAFGGGSAMDCGKATGIRVARPNKPLGEMEGILKVHHQIPLLIAIPTTAGTGSEATLAAVVTDSETRHKYAINDFALIPKYTLLDPNLTLKLPPKITAATGMDALTHAIEAYIGRSTTKQTRRQALEAIRLIFQNIETVYKAGNNLEARAKMLEASYLAGLAFTQSYVGYVHAMAHALGGKYDVPHGLANAVLLPYVLECYRPKIDRKLYEIAVHGGITKRNTSETIAADLLINKIIELDKKMGLGTNIPELRAKDIPELAKTAEKEANPLYPVPVLWDAGEITQVYKEVLR